MKIILTLVSVLVSLPVLPSIAQIPSVPGIPKTPGVPSVPGIPSTPSLPRELNPNNPQNNNQNLDDLPDDPNQLRNWVCARENARIAVSAKDVTGWKEMVEKQEWNCTEENSDIPDRTLNLTCEPEQTLGILTIYWLEGANGKQQLTAWKNEIAETRGMICTLKNTQFFDSPSDLLPNLDR